jgi:hypothetical protein
MTCQRKSRAIAPAMISAATMMAAGERFIYRICARSRFFSSAEPPPPRRAGRHRGGWSRPIGVVVEVFASRPDRRSLEP